MKFVVNMMKGEHDKESVEKPEVLALPAPSFSDDSKPPPVQNGTPAVPTEDEMYVLRECSAFFILNPFNIIYMFEFESSWRRLTQALSAA